jgi:hypothetical protein
MGKKGALKTKMDQTINLNTKVETHESTQGFPPHIPQTSHDDGSHVGSEHEHEQLPPSTSGERPGLRVCVDQANAGVDPKPVKSTNPECREDANSQIDEAEGVLASEDDTEGDFSHNKIRIAELEQALEKEKH